MATLNGKPLMSLRVVDLKEELQKRGLSKNGAKKDLVERLEQYILEHEIEDTDVAAGEASESSKGSDEGVSAADPPSMQIEANLEENDIVREYMMMRQTQFKSTMEEVEQTKKSGSSQDEEDEPLHLKRSPRKRRGRGGQESSSEAEEGSKSPQKSVKDSPVTIKLNKAEEDAPLKPPKASASPQKLDKSEVEDVKSQEMEAKSPIKEAQSPVKEAASPVKEAKSPLKEAKSPIKEAKSPIKEAPEKETKAHEKDAHEKEAKAPVKEPTVSPVKPAKSPIKEAPEKEAKAPEKEAKSPTKEATAEPVVIPKETEAVKSSRGEMPKEGTQATNKSQKVSKKETHQPLVKEPESEAVDEIVVSEPVTFDKDEEDNSNEEVPSVEKEPITFRKLSRLASNNGSGGGESRKKRTWGDTKKASAKGDLPSTVSSSELKDIIPDIKPVLEEIKNEEEQKMDDEIGEKEEVPALPKPTVDDPQEIQEKLAPVAEKNKNQSRVIEIRNLVRPFTHNNLISLLKRTGSFDETTDFWIDKIKSHALVKYQSPSEAEETVLALDGVKWPQSNVKKLIVTFSSDEHFDTQSKEAVSLSKPLPTQMMPPETTTTTKKRTQPEHHDEEPRKRPRKESEKAAADVEEQKARKELKSLDVLFHKTKALPSIYWLPRKTS